MRLSLIHWTFLVAASAMPLQAFGVAWRDKTPDAWALAWLSLGLGLVGVGTIRSTLTTRQPRDRVLGATGAVLAFQVLGAAVPAELGVVLTPVGLVATGVVWLWLAGHIHT